MIPFVKDNGINLRLKMHTFNGKFNWIQNERLLRISKIKVSFRCV